MRTYLPKATVVISIITLLISAAQLIHCKTTKVETRKAADRSGDPDDFNDAVEKNMKEMFDKGKAVFRFETFGDEAFCTGCGKSLQFL